MPSMTPCEDAARTYKPRQETLDAMNAPGGKGVRTRIIVAMVEAYGLTIARELDRASDGQDIVDGFSAALANVAFGVAGTLTDDVRTETCQRIVDAMAKHLGVLLALPDDHPNRATVSFERVARS
jgi:hypothetical protein